ncbi:fimbrial biogenesis outer membrane usher protein, partial [Enterobacter hormaechei]|nr:fimbrial biogenesis outer membrane usher protein [Enterobacter hormaechei]
SFILILFNVHLSNGKPAPFGATGSATLDTGSVTGIVGEEGELYLSGMPEKGQFTLTLNDGATCRAEYTLQQQPDAGLVQMPVTCR